MHQQLPHTSNNHNQQSQQAHGQEDSRRTLIKNQLYLIEQLQLENANLRNERDHLQLENEELKFHLQMISSSSFLGHSPASACGIAFDDDCQVTKSSETITVTGTNNDARTTRTPRVNNEGQENANCDDNERGLPTAASESNNLSQCYHSVKCQQANQHTTRPVSGIITTKTTQTNLASTTIDIIGEQEEEKEAGFTTTAASDNSSKQQANHLQLLTKITATPVRRQPLRLMNCDDLTFESNRDTRRRVANSTGASTITTKNNAQQIDHLAKNVTGHEQQTNLVVASLTTQIANGVARVEPNSGQQLVASLLTEDHDDGDDDEQDQRACNARARLAIQQLYGDCDSAQAAAVVIQRAFRKHQICKRFRMITDQLRAHTQPAGDRRQRSRAEDNGVAYASGATRAAAWESLSQAASRLAASAAAAARQQTNGGPYEPTSEKHLIDTNIKTLSDGPTTIETTSSSSTLASNSSDSSGHRTMPTARSTASAREQQQQPIVAPLSFQQLESIRKRQYRVGLNIFNKSPEKGISFLIAHSFIDCSPPYSRSCHAQTNNTTTSYYLSNQLHFIDKQHCLTAGATQQQQQQQTRLQTTTTSDIQTPQTIGAVAAPAAAAILMDAVSRESCRFCLEEENLKINVAHFLLHRKGLAKEKIGQYLGNLQCKFNQDVLVYYLQELDFYGLQVDVALRKFSTSVRMPGEAQKIERFVDRFAARYVECQQQQTTTLRPNSATDDFMTSIARAISPPPILISASNNNGTANEVQGNNCTNTKKEEYKNNLTLLTRDEIFILTFAIIMLNTDLHSPSLKSTSRMSPNQFINNLRGVFKSQTINESDLIEIYERVKTKQITTTPDHVTHVMKVQQGLTTQNFREKKELPNLCVAHRRLVCFCRLFEVYDINKKERPGQHQREIFLFNDMLLVTKLARGRTRANTPQQYTYRQSIMLKGLYVQLFRSAHYCYGIRLCQRFNDATLIMFNARNELDQSRFVDDLNESIAEMDEMETIRAHNIVETIHFKQQDRLRRHQMMHDPSQGLITTNEKLTNQSPQNTADLSQAPSSGNNIAEADDSFATNGSSVTVIQVSKSRRVSSSKFSSMSNLASLAESDESEKDGTETMGDNTTRGKDGSHPDCALGPNRQSFADAKTTEHQSNSHKSSPQRLGHHLASTVTNGLAGRILRSCSTNSVHSLDSGLFLSRDVSPNQSG